MPKNILRDVMTKERRSIREVSMPRGKRAAVEEEDIIYEREDVEVEEFESTFPWRRVFLWGAAFLFLVFLGIALATSFTGARVTVTPKTQLLSVAHEFTATRDTSGKLRFEVLPISQTEELLIPADTTKKVSERASGTINIYNNFSDKPQKLIKNTRFQTPNGLIYRVGQSVVVPGKTVKDGRTIPGSVEAIVSADSPGTEYNAPLSDFTIPGFKTDAGRYAGFYARSKTPLVGGLEGMVKVPGDAAIAGAVVLLKKSLQEKVAKSLESAVPEGYVLFKGAVSTTEETLSPQARDGGLSAVRERSIGAAYIFKKADIAQAIALRTLQSDLPIEIPELDTLSFAAIDSPSAGGTEVKTLRFTLNGNVRAVWLFNAEKLQASLLGKPKGDLASVLAAFPTIEKIDLVLRPFWSRSFPTNPNKVTVERSPAFADIRAIAE